jgi:hypothetical protein
MNPQPDDQQWLRSIGVATAHSDNAAPAPGHRDGIPADAPTAEDTDDDTEISNPPTDPITTADTIIDLDTDPATTARDDDTATPPARRFTPWVAALFAAVAITATAATAGTAALSSQSPAPAAAPTPARAARPPSPAPAPPPPSQSADTPIPFTASADCPPGSTAAQSVADPQARTPWICARTVDGQVLHIDLGRAYVITAVSIVPGAVNTTGSDEAGDPWLAHRVVTRIQWQFNDTDNTVRSQNTDNIRGEAVQPVPNVLASAVTVIIQQTSRPPATAPTTTSAPAAGDPQPRGDGFGLILGTGAPTADPQPPTLPGQPLPADPSDGTFAVTAIKVIGHRAI